MESIDGHVRQRSLAGVRWSIVLNLVMIPLSFGTNMALGRTSPEALGYYGAIQIFTGAFHAFFVPGGRDVFTRFVPGIPRRERLAFLGSYSTVALLVFLVFLVIVGWIAPGAMAWIVGYFRMPEALLALALAVALLVFAFATNFLYGALQAPRAVITIKAVIVGYFILAILGAGPFRAMLRSEPSVYLWRGALIVNGFAALLGIVQVMRTAEMRRPRVWKWGLPTGFWPAVGYTHLGTVVTFAYTSLVPAFVLLWLEVTALARLHAALRFVVLLSSVPVIASPVVAAGISKLDASGMRETGRRHASSAMRGSLVAIFPMFVLCVLFAGDAMAIFNPEFREHRTLLRIVILSCLASPVVHFGAGLAVALGAFRPYLMASLVFVASGVGLTTVLVPRFGLLGAGCAAAGAVFIQQMAVAAVLRYRLAFRIPGRVYAAWACGLATTAVALWLDPSRLLATGLFPPFVLVFAWAGRVTPSELAGWGRRLLSRSQDGPPTS
jgi:O-antigen/teichoic acid export membrane protein